MRWIASIVLFAAIQPAQGKLNPQKDPLSEPKVKNRITNEELVGLAGLNEADIKQLVLQELRRQKGSITFGDNMAVEKTAREMFIKMKEYAPERIVSELNKTDVRRTADGSPPKATSQRKSYLMMCISRARGFGRESEYSLCLGGPNEVHIVQVSSVNKGGKFAWSEPFRTSFVVLDDCKDGFVGGEYELHDRLDVGRILSVGGAIHESVLLRPGDRTGPCKTVMIVSAGAGVGRIDGRRGEGSGALKRVGTIKISGSSGDDGSRSSGVEMNNDRTPNID